jgi:hypothetical protein
MSLTGSFTADDKVYDGTTDARIATSDLNGKITGDVVTLASGTASFDNKNVGTGKTVTVSGAALSGADAGNYRLAQGRGRPPRASRPRRSPAASRLRTRRTTATTLRP